MNPIDDDHAYICDLATDLLRIGSDREAFAILEPIVEHPDAPVKALLLAGHAAVLLSHNQIAIPLLKRAQALSPETGVIYEDLAAAYIAENEHQNAHDILEIGILHAEQKDQLHVVQACLDLNVMRRDTARARIAAIAKTPLWQDVTLQPRALLALHEGAWATALSLCAKKLGVPLPTPESAPAAPPSRHAATPRRVPFSSPPRVVLATSLSPRSGEAQTLALRTWEGFAVDILSVNTAPEIAVLAPLHPGIRFIETDRNGQDLVGKPLIFIDDILAALAKADTDLVGIVNADILLCDGPRLLGELQAAGREALTICHRRDMRAPDDPTTIEYLMGFDAFFFSPSQIPHFQGSTMLLGAPWWDYLLPSLAIISGIPIRIPERAAIGHVRHVVNWSNKIFDETYRIWGARLLEHDSVHPPIADFLRPLLQGVSLVFTPPDDPSATALHPSSNPHWAFRTLAMIANHLIRTQATPLTAETAAPEDRRP